MRTIILFTGLAVLLALWLLQAFLASKQKAAQQNLEASNEDGIYLFTLPNCPICGQMKRIHAEPIQRGQITTVAIEQNREAAINYNILSVPTTLVIRNRKVVHAYHGFVKPAEMAQWLPN